MKNKGARGMEAHIETQWQLGLGQDDILFA